MRYYITDATVYSIRTTGFFEFFFIFMLSSFKYYLLNLGIPPVFQLFQKLYPFLDTLLIIQANILVLYFQIPAVPITSYIKIVMILS